MKSHSRQTQHRFSAFLERFIEEKGEAQQEQQRRHSDHEENQDAMLEAHFTLGIPSWLWPVLISMVWVIQLAAH